MNRQTNSLGISLLFTLALLSSHVCPGASAPPTTRDAPGRDNAEADAFLADLSAKPEAEQRKQLDELIAQLPPNAAAGDSARARRLLLAALDRGGDAIHRALWLAPVDKSAPIILDGLAHGTRRGRTVAMDLVHLAIARTGRADLFHSALPALREALASDDKSLRASAASALRQMGEDGVRCLLAALGNRDVLARGMGILGTLHRAPLDYGSAAFIADYPDVALPLLEQAVKGNDPGRRNALELLKRIAPEGKQMVPLLLPLLEENDPEIRASAAFVLGLYGSPASPAVPTLMKLTVADDRASRLAASEALGRIGVEARQIEGLWPGVLRTEREEYERRWLAYAVASPGRAAMPALIQALSHPDASVRSMAAYACANLGPVAAPAAKHLLKSASSEEEASWAEGAMYALGELGSTAAPLADELIPLLERARFDVTRAGSLSFEPEEARALCRMGPDVLPALYKGLASNKAMVQAGCARALGLMDPVEARGATDRLLKLFDESKDSGVRLVAMEALIALAANPKQLVPRLRPLAVPGGRDLAGLADWYLKDYDQGRAPGSRRSGYPGGEIRMDPAAFAWGRPAGGLQLGATLVPLVYDMQKSDPDVQRLAVAVRNIGGRPVILPRDPARLFGLDVRLSEAPDVLLLCRPSGFDRPPQLSELRPGQILVTEPFAGYRLAYGRRNEGGRWTPFTSEDKEYHLTVTLRGLDAPDPPHAPCYASAAIRKECWQGNATSGTIVVRLDSASQRQRSKTTR